MATEATTPAASTGETEQTPATNTNQTTEQASAQQAEVKTPNLHGFTEEQLADMEKFYASVGGYEKVKSRLSNPDKYTQPAQTTEQKTVEVQNQPQTQPQPQPQSVKLPEGYLTPQAMAVSGFFRNLAEDEKFKPIAKEVASGAFIKDMEALGMKPVDENGNLNMTQINGYLELKAKTVPAAQTSTEPAASSAPLVEYVKVEGDQIKDLNQAYAIITQDAQLKRQGQTGHPSVAKAEEFIKNNLAKKDS